jgi:hypothetical protein
MTFYDSQMIEAWEGDALIAGLIVAGSCGSGWTGTG